MTWLRNGKERSASAQSCREGRAGKTQQSDDGVMTTPWAHRSSLPKSNEDRQPV
jgi:hypothetical protein